MSRRRKGVLYWHPIPSFDRFCTGIDELEVADVLSHLSKLTNVYHVEINIEVLHGATYVKYFSVCCIPNLQHNPASKIEDAEKAMRTFKQTPTSGVEYPIIVIRKKRN